jgi:hypothetical protein
MEAAPSFGNKRKKQVSVSKYNTPPQHRHVSVNTIPVIDLDYINSQKKYPSTCK